MFVHRSEKGADALRQRNTNIKIFLTLFICMICICIAVPARTTVFAGECPFSREEFLHIIEDAEAAAAMYTRPEYNNTNSRVAEFDRLFIPKYIELSSVYNRDDKMTRLIGGFSRPAVFMSFLEQYFSGSVISSLAGEAVVFDLEEDQVYWRYLTPQFSYDTGEAEYSFPVFSADKIVCHADFTFENDYTGSFDYVYEKTGGGWLFTSFATRISIYERLLTESGGAEDGADADKGGPVSSSAAGSLFAVLLLGAAAFYACGKKNKKQTQRLFMLILCVFICAYPLGCVSRPSTLPPENTGVGTETAAPTNAPDHPEPAGNTPAGSDANGDDWDYVRYGGESVILTRYTGSGTDVTIPAEIDGNAVVSAESCFKNVAGAAGISSLTVPGSVTFDERIFDGLTGLRKLTLEKIPDIKSKDWPATIPENVKTVLSGITELTLTNETAAGAGFLSLCTGLKTVSFSKGLETVENDAFSGLSSLETLEFSSVPVTIGDNAFRDCASLRTNPVGEKTASVGNFAFYGCKSMTGDLVIGGNVTYVGKYAFAGCDSVSRLIFDAPACRVEPLSSGYEGGTVCFGMNGLREVVVGENVTELVPFLFSGGTFTGISIRSAGLKKIGAGSFACCPYLREIDLPEALEVIGNDAFYGCCSLSGIRFPRSLVSVGNYAFMNCDRLKSVDTGTLGALPEGVFSGCADLESLEVNCGAIGDRAFYLCTGLTGISMPENVKLGEDVFGLCVKFGQNQPFRIPDNRTGE